MTIRKVEVDEYDHDGVHEGRLIVSEFAGKCVLQIVGGGDRVCVLWDDLQRAWQAVK